MCRWVTYLRGGGGGGVGREVEVGGGGGLSMITRDACIHLCGQTDQIIGTI